MSRPSMPDIYMDMAFNISMRSTCTERHVGAVITSKDFENVYSIGYNGNYKGGPNTCDHVGIKCGCIHAEINALIKCSIKDKQKVMFVTLAPCEMCAKTMINSGFSTIYYGCSWKDNPGISLLEGAGIKCIHLEQYQDALQGQIVKLNL